MTKNKTLTVRRIIAITSAVLVLVLLGLLTWFVMTRFKQISTAESFRDYIKSFGVWSYAVGFSVQVMQVFVAFIPGEAVEIGMGYAFGALIGTFLCYAGVAAATLVIFTLVKRFGKAAVSLFVSDEQMKSTGFVAKYIHDRDKLRKIAFVLFFIPGTPKDLLSYVFPLTPIGCGEFLVISLIARFPSVISSTVGGMLIHNGRIAAAAILFAVTAAVSFAGWIGYEKYTKHTKNAK